jgi:GNAT superfamily N-acetyltransferase
MQIKIFEETSEVLADYEKISIAFRVETFFRFELLDEGLGGVKLTEKSVETPFTKDYDECDEDRPTRWAERFDLSNWGFLSAFDSEKRIGAAAIALKTPEIFMLEGRDDLACLWDLRISPGYRDKGFGHQLFTYALEWAKERNCRLFKVETQNINVPACRFYARQGCHLGAFNLHAYPESLKEIQLIWYRNL